MGWIIGIGVATSFVVSLVWAITGMKFSSGVSRSSLTDPPKPNAADAAMLSAVVNLVGEDDIESAIEVLQLQRKRKSPQ